MKYCYKCKKKPPIEELAEIEVNGIKLHIKNSNFCVDCLTKEFNAGFEFLTGRKPIGNKNGMVKINWKMIDRLEEEARSFAYDILLAMNILSLSADDSYQIIAYGGIALNPRHFLSLLYFKRKEDAIDFAIATLSNTLYSWEIQHITDVLTKSDIMGQK